MDYEYSGVANSNSASGYAGVRWDKKREKWIAQIKYFGQTLHLGSFPRLLDALDARESAEKFYGAMRPMHKPSTMFKER